MSVPVRFLRHPVHGFKWNNISFTPLRKMNGGRSFPFVSARSQDNFARERWVPLSANPALIIQLHSFFTARRKAWLRH